MRRLVVLGDSLTALTVARHAARKRYDVHVVSTEGGIAGHTRVATVHALDPSLSDGTAVSLLETLATPGPVALVATSDAWLQFVADVRPRLEAAAYDILHPPNSSLGICLDKGRFARWCDARGFRVPPCWIGPEISQGDGLPFPLVLRPVTTSHGMAGGDVPKAREVGSPAELADVMRQYATAGVEPIASASLLGDNPTLFSVACARSPRGMLSFVAKKIRPTPELCAVGTYVELCPHEPAERLARAALEALDFYGIAEVEVLHTDPRDECLLIEINARPWVQYGLAPWSHHDFLGFLLEDEWRPDQRQRKQGLRWINFDEDAYVCFSRTNSLVRAGRVRFRDYLASLLRANVYSTFDVHDLGPFLHNTRTTVARVLRRSWRGRASG